MELFEVKYEGQKILVQKDERGGIFVLLPTRFGDRGAAYRETIMHEQRGWRFTSTQDDDIEYYFHMWLKDDGRIAWTNDMSYRIQEFNEPFNPNYPNAGVLNDTALKLYSIVKQIEAYQKRDIPATELFLLRQYYLTTSLKMLGYDSIEAVINDNKSSVNYLGLNAVACQLEEYRDLSGIAFSMGEIRGEETILCMAPESVDRKKALEMAKPVKDKIEDNIRFIQKEDSDLSKKRAILPGYRDKMAEKVGVYSYDNYEKALRDAALLLLELNADLLTSEQREQLGIEGTEVLSDLDLKDKISNLIDSRDFNSACRVESEFAYGQSMELVKKAKEKIKIQDEGTGDIIRIINEEAKQAEDRKKSLDNHERYNFKKREKPKGYSLDDE